MCFYFLLFVKSIWVCLKVTFSLSLDHKWLPMLCFWKRLFSQFLKHILLLSLFKCKEKLQKKLSKNSLSSLFDYRKYD